MLKCFRSRSQHAAEKELTKLVLQDVMPESSVLG